MGITSRTILMFCPRGLTLDHISGLVRCSYAFDIWNHFPLKVLQYKQRPYHSLSRLSVGLFDIWSFLHTSYNISSKNFIMIIQTFAFVALLQSFLVAGQYSVQPCFDSRCSNCSPSLYSVNAGYPAAGAYENFTLAGAPSTNSSGGYNVWWRVSRPDTNCDILIMEQYSTSNFTGNVGNVILSTSNGGCYNTPQMHSDQWFTQFCCGNGDCQGAGASTAAQAPSPRRHKKRHVGHRQSIRQAANNSAQPANGNSTTQTSTNSTQPTSTNNSTQPTATITPASTVTASSHAQTARPTSTQTTSSAPSVRDDNTWCNEKDLTDYVKCVNFSCTAATRVGDPYQKSGEQIQATQQLSCDSATSCPQTIGNAIAVGSTLTNERSFTHTTSEGISIGLEAGCKILFTPLIFNAET